MYSNLYFLFGDYLKYHYTLSHYLVRGNQEHIQDIKRPGNSPNLNSIENAKVWIKL
jgi:hypothetical protein